MKLDTHVHTVYSGKSTLTPLDRLLLESYNAVEDVYRLAKSRAMDLVAITDPDEIDGALTIAHRPDVIVGCDRFNRDLLVDLVARPTRLARLPEAG